MAVRVFGAGGAGAKRKCQDNVELLSFFSVGCLIDQTELRGGNEKWLRYTNLILVQQIFSRCMF